MSKQMFVKLVVVLLVFVAFAAQGAQASSTVFQSPPPLPPPNDNFSSAMVVTSLPFSDSVDLTYATTENNEPQYCNWAQGTVWYSFTPSASRTVRVTLTGLYDGNLVTYQASGPFITNLQEINCTSWGSPLSLTFNVNAGTTYYFQVGSIYGIGQTRQLTVEAVPAPANDNFADSKLITTVPYDDSTDMTAASRQANEPVPSCGFSGKTVWYAYTPATSGSLSQRTETWSYTGVGVYTGSSLGALQEVACRQNWYDSSFLTFHVDGGKTYYFQVTTNDNGWVPFHLQVAEPPYPNFGFYPSDPNVFDTVHFENWSWDPANAGISSIFWDFGDGATATEPWSPSHRYAKDGDYTVKLTVTTTDGRTASTTQVVRVKTHDVAITKFTVPQSAKAGQTRPLVVGLNSKRYVEDVEVQLFKSLPGGGWQLFGTLRQTVPVRPANRTTDFSFNYTFTKDDAAIGKVTFRAVATILNARDALPADNEAIALPTKVTP